MRRFIPALILFLLTSLSFAQSEIRFESASAGGAGAAHDILSATHSDTLAASVARGSLVVGNSTPKWSKLVIGANNRVLRSDGTDAAWSQVSLATDITGILPFGNGGTGLSSAADDTVMVSDSTQWQAKAVPNCTDASGNHLNYTAATNSFSCGTTTSGGPVDAQYIVGAADGTLTSERVATSGQHVSVTIGASTATYEYTYSRHFHVIEEEFVSGTTSGNQIGYLGWALGAGTLTGVAGTQSHPGVVQLSSTNSSGTVGRMHLGVGGTAPYVYSDVSYMAFLVNPQSGTTTMSARFGMLVSVTGSGEASQGVYWSFLPGTSANWRTVTRDGSGITSNSTSTAYATSTWFFLEIKRASNGTDWEFYLNGALQFTHTTNLLTTTAGIPGHFIETNEAVAKTTNCDYFAIATINPMGARF